MGSLGALGKAKEPVELSFDWFGHEVRVATLASDLIELDFLERASQIDLSEVDLDAPIQSPKALKAMSQAARIANEEALHAVRQLIHPDDWAVFWRTAIEQGQNLTDLMELSRTLTRAITEARSGFPTGRPSDSSGGSLSTAPKSGDVSPSPASDGDRALAQLRGRPDLQEFVVMAEEAQQARAVSVG